MGIFTCLTSGEQKCGKTKFKAIDYCRNRAYSTNLKIFTRCQYVVALALSIAVAACATRSQPRQGHSTAVPKADAFQHGLAAYDRQDYVTALRYWRSLAQQGNALAQYHLGV